MEQMGMLAEILNLTPKGDHLGVAQAFCDPYQILALCPEDPKRDQNPKFTPPSDTTSIPVSSYGSSPPRALYAQMRDKP